MERLAIWLYISLEACLGGSLLGAVSDLLDSGLPPQNRLLTIGICLVCGAAAVAMFGMIADLLSGSLAALGAGILKFCACILIARPEWLGLANNAAVSAPAASVLYFAMIPLSFRLVHLCIQKDAYKDIYAYLTIMFAGAAIGLATTASFPSFVVFALLGALTAFGAAAFFLVREREDARRAAEDTRLLRAIPERLDPSRNRMLWSIGALLFGFSCGAELLAYRGVAVLTGPVLRPSFRAVCLLSLFSAAAGTLLARTWRVSARGAARLATGALLISAVLSGWSLSYLMAYGYLFQKPLLAQFLMAGSAAFAAGIIAAELVRLVLSQLATLTSGVFYPLAAGMLGLSASLMLFFSGPLANLGVSGLLLVPTAAAFFLALLQILTGRAGLLKSLAIFLLIATVAGLTAWNLPEEKRIWAKRHGVYPDQIAGIQDSNCLAAVIAWGSENFIITADGTEQGQVPFSPWQLDMGFGPVSWHPSPQRVLILGMGSGALPYAVSLDRRVKEVVTVELCEPLVQIQADLDHLGVAESAFLLKDSRQQFSSIDRGSFLANASSEAGYDLIFINQSFTRLEPRQSGAIDFAKLRRLLKPAGILVLPKENADLDQDWDKQFAFAYAVDVPKGGFRLASDSPISFTPKALPEALGDPALQDGLRQIRAFLRENKPPLVLKSPPKGAEPAPTR